MPPTTADLAADHRWIGAVEDEWSMYSNRSEDYVPGAPIGFGASSTVYEAQYFPGSQSDSKPIPCALKVLDLDALPQDALSFLYRESQLMSINKHPNVIRVRGTWIEGTKLYIAMRLMNKGSAADVMRYGWPGGLEEEVVRCILKQALEGINYLHINGLIHRDIKAANLLVSDDGTVLIGDLGVAASLVNNDLDHKTASTRRNVVTGDHGATKKKIGKRKSFVGTPCWMAPELIQGKQYDSSADIWSFGITALELAQGRPPLSRETAKKVLMQIVTNAPPALDRSGGEHKYSRAFEELVELCLNKDPTKRPTAAELLQRPFFKNAKKPSYLVGAILNDLPPLKERQERRRNPSMILHRTVDSWDFTLPGGGVRSAHSSVGGRSALSSVTKKRRASHREYMDGMAGQSTEPSHSPDADIEGMNEEMFDFDIIPPAVPEVEEADPATMESITKSNSSTSLNTPTPNSIPTTPLTLVPSLCSSGSDSDPPATPPTDSSPSNTKSKLSFQRQKAGSRQPTSNSLSSSPSFFRALTGSKNPFTSFIKNSSPES